MAHRLYDAGRTALIAGAALTAGRDQANRMLAGAAALRAASANLVAARQSRAATLQRLADSEKRLAKAKAERAALRG